MDISDERLNDITNYVVDLRNNDVFIPTDLSSENELPNNNNGNTTRTAYLVVDTNFILSHLSLLDDLERLLHTKYMGTYQIVIPKQVVHELDGLKDADRTIDSRHSISRLARSAIDWCYLHFHESMPTVTGQRLHERIDKNALKDNAILDCCLYFQNVENGGGNMVVLLSNDKNLCVKALVNNVLTISYRLGMTADLIANNVVSELNNNYNFDDSSNQMPPEGQFNSNDSNVLMNNDDMDVEPIYIQENTIDLVPDGQDTSTPNSTSSPYFFHETSEEIFSQVTTLTLEAIKYAVESIFEDDIEMVGYDDSKMRTLLDAARCIVKMGLSTFSEFFDRRRFNPMKMLQDRGQMQIYVNVPKDVPSLKTFVAFWTDFLEGIYANRGQSQKAALSQIINHWQGLIKRL